jgi:serine phosphatase RsbU (regulator of sigma subunit)
MDTICLASGVKQPLKRLLTVNGTGTGHGAKIPASYMMKMMMMIKQCLEAPSFKVTIQ